MVDRFTATNGKPSGLGEDSSQHHSKSDSWVGVGRIGAFFLLIVVFAFALDHTITSALQKIDTSSFGVWNRIVHGRAGADILITGSSRALNHYDPAVIAAFTGTSSFNIGLNGSQIDMQLARLRTYLAHNPRPRLIIHNLDLYTFQLSHSEVYDPGQYIAYLDQPYLFESLERITPDMWKSRYIPLYGYVVEDLRFTWLKGIGFLLGWRPLEDHPLGFNPRSQAWTGDFEAFRAAHSSGLRVNIESRAVQELEALIKLCNDQMIELILVYSPEYREMQSITKNREEIFDLFRELSVRHSTPFWDYSDSDISEDRKNFYNSQHLNADGAAKFSGLIAARISAHSLVGAQTPLAGAKQLTTK
jgi:hypothetical protein